MFLLLSSNALQGLTHVNKAVEPLTTTKQRYINNKANASEMQVFIR